MTGTEDGQRGTPDRRPTAILILATLQGFALYALHQALKNASWPATQLALLAPAYLLVVLLPLTAQLLIRHGRHPVLQRALAAGALLLVAVGVSFAKYVVPGGKTSGAAADLVFANALPLLVLWLVLVAFLRARLESGHWHSNYPALFAAAWRNKLTLLEAAVFTGLFWLLLALWAALFTTLKIGFFRELFDEPLFVYPVTAIVFGFALHLIGSIDRLVDVLLGQLLNVFKWLAPLAGLIVALFALALLPRLPELFANAQRPLSAVWLLWIVAVTVVLLNAAFQDGRAERPWGAAISQAMRAVPPLLLVIAITAAYAVWVRMDTFGVTVSRYWGLVTAVMALAYSLSYAVTALRGGPWMQGMGRANPLLAALLCALLLLSLTPLLSPYRLAARSQQQVALRTQDAEQRDSALGYLRFDSGEPGLRRLRALATGGGAATNTELRARADKWLRKTERWGPGATMEDYDAWRAQVSVFPTDRPLPPALEQRLREVVERGDWLTLAALREEDQPIAAWTDLTGDASEDLLVVVRSQYLLFSGAADDWALASKGSVWWEIRDQEAYRNSLASGDFGASEAPVRDLRVGKDILRFVPEGVVRGRAAASR